MADRIAAEVGQAHQRAESRLVKVTSLMSAFRSPGKPARINEVIRLLRDREITIESGWDADSGEMSVRRPGLLKLSMSGSTGEPRGVGDETIQVSSWNARSGMSPERALGTYEEPSAENVLWFNVDPLNATELGSSNIEPAQGNDLASVAPRTAFEERVRHVADRLGEWSPGSTRK